MTITVELPPEVETKIKTQAKHDGLKVEDYVKTLIKEASERRERVEKNSEKSFDEILKPFRDEVEASGITDDEFDDFVEEIREEIYQEKIAKQSEK